ncbi:MAG: fibronectin type III domain-containing protein, partial [Angustibacter sp.]
YNRSSSLDQTYGDHVLITDDAGAVSSACGGNCSGVSLVGTFDDTWRTDSYYEPAWVFSSKTYGSAILTGHTVAHEVGHTFGLTHDGDASHEYSDGHGNWFPIMGSGVRGVGQFSIGEYAGANNQQDDLAVIAQHGAPVRADDYGNTPSSAQPMGSGTAVAGVISTRADQDVFAVAHDCDTRLTARATGIGAGASLDMSVTVLAADGTSVVGSADPTSGQDTSWPAVPTGMDASVTVSAPRGTYYVRIDGVGKGDPATNGYSDYASLGDYVLAVSACDGTMPTVPIMNTPVGTTSGTTTDTTGTSKPGAPSMPRIGRASAGKRGGPVTATVRWARPASQGRTALVGYKVRIERVTGAGRVVQVLSSHMLTPGSHAATLKLPRGHYRFRVVAYNRAGGSPYSAPSRVVTAR